MAGETDLGELLASMRPGLGDGVYVFITVPPGQDLAAGIDPLMSLQEREGRTFIISEAAAIEAGVESSFRCRMITLSVHSSLEAVGFIAAVATRLAEAGVGANPVSGFYHDHLFVQADRAEDALSVLLDLAEQARQAPKG